MRKNIQIEEQFNKISCRDYGKLYLAQGDVTSLEIEADQELLSDIIAEVQGDTLVLGLDSDWFGGFGKVLKSMFDGTDRKVSYYLTVPDIDKLSISGNINLTCEQFKSDDLTIKVSGLGHITMSQLECDALEVLISGRGEFAAAGRADHQSVRISGSGEYETPNLSSQSMRIVISGQGNATVRVSEHLDINISGLGQVNYYGHPKLHQVISGLGKSKRLND